MHCCHGRLLAVVITLAVMMLPEVRGGAGEPLKALIPPVEDGPFLRPAAVRERGADLGHPGRHRRRALAEPWPARLDSRLHSLPGSATPHADELHRRRAGGRAGARPFRA